MNNNKIELQGAERIAELIAKAKFKLKTLECAWNNIGELC
jgi:hypothetical protein